MAPASSSRRASPGLRRAHQRFANQRGVEPGVAQADEVVGGLDAALRNLGDASGHARGQFQRSVQVHAEAVQVAIVDADDGAAGVERALQFGGIVHLAQHAESELAGGAVQVFQLRLAERGDDQQHGAGAVGLRFEQLEVVHDEVFAQARQGSGAGGDVEIFQRALEVSLVGEHGERGGAGGFQFARQLGDGEVGANQALGGRSFLQLGDDGQLAVVVSQFQAEATRLAGGGLDHERIAGCRSLGSGDALAAGSNDFVQAAGHGVEKV